MFEPGILDAADRRAWVARRCISVRDSCGTWLRPVKLSAENQLRAPAASN